MISHCALDLHFLIASVIVYSCGLLAILCVLVGKMSIQAFYSFFNQTGFFCIELNEFFVYFIY